METSKLVIEFDSSELREYFLGWLCDAGGEDDFIETVGNVNITVDYSKAFTAHGYNPKVDGDPLITIEEN